MYFPLSPENEAQRIAEIKKYNLLDTLSEDDFDNITSLLSTICEVPIALISLLDKNRAFFKSHKGIDFNQLPRQLSFCDKALQENNDIFIIEDTRNDPQFKDSALIKSMKAIFYASAPLINSNGYVLGALCILDHEPRKLNQMQQDSLKALAKQVVILLELRKKNTLLLEYQKELQHRNERLIKFAHLVSHDLKSPLANITSLTRLLREENSKSLSEDSELYLTYIEESSSTLKNYINGILKFYKSEELIDAKKKDVSLNDLFAEVSEILITEDIVFDYPHEGILKSINKAALTQIFLNLIDNSLKYNSNKKRLVKVEYFEEKDCHRFSIKDNGMGIDLGVQEEIFSLFTTTGVKDRDGNEGTGIGLATVKSLVSKLGGVVSLESEPTKGSTFTFTLLK